MENKKFKLVHVILIFIGIPFLANLLAVFFDYFIAGNYIFGRYYNEFKALDLKMSHDFLYIFSVLSFLVPVLLILYYISPFIRFYSKHLKENEEMHAKMLSRVLNAPVVISFFCFLGWIIGMAGALWMANHVKKMSPGLFDNIHRLLGPMIMQNLLLAMVCFIFVFFALDAFSRRLLVPFFFLNQNLFETKKIFRLSIHKKFMIYFFAVSVYPLILLMTGIYQISHASQASENLLDFFKGAKTILIVSLIYGYVLTQILSRTYSNPLGKMKKATSRIKKGDYSVHLPVVSVDEIGSLAEGFNTMSAEIKNYITQVTDLNKNLEEKVMIRTAELQEERNKIKLRNTEIEKEIEMAKVIQEQLIPKGKILDHIASFYKPMDQVGGDFFDFVVFQEGKNVGVFLSDVSGHGIPAAFITSMIKSFIIQAGDLRKDPGALLSYLNTGLCGRTGGNFVTAFYGIYNPNERKFFYSCAGHNPFYLINHHGAMQCEMPKRGLPLAIMENDLQRQMNKSYENYEMHLEKSDKIILYTDGLTESGKKDNENLYFEEVIERELLALKPLKAEEFINALYQKLIAFHGSEHFEDDVCMICIDVE